MVNGVRGALVLDVVTLVNGVRGALVLDVATLVNGVRGASFRCSYIGLMVFVVL